MILFVIIAARLACAHLLCKGFFHTCVICVHPQMPMEKNERVVKTMAPCTARYFIRSAIFRMITLLESFCEHGDGSHFSC